MSRIHSVYFMTTDGWNEILATHWLKKHNLMPIKPVHYMGDELRYRIEDPKHFNFFRTKKIQTHNASPVYLVLGWNTKLSKQK